MKATSAVVHEYAFEKCDLAESFVDARKLVATLKSRYKGKGGLQLLVLSAGFVSLTGERNAVGVEKMAAVALYGRNLLALQLAPLLEEGAQAGIGARMITVLHAKRVGSKLVWDDLELKKDRFRIMTSSQEMLTMTNLMNEVSSTFPSSRSR